MQAENLRKETCGCMLMWQMRTEPVAVSSLHFCQLQEIRGKKKKVFMGAHLFSMTKLA